MWADSHHLLHHRLWKKMTFLEETSERNHRPGQEGRPNTKENGCLMVGVLRETGAISLEVSEPERGRCEMGGIGEDHL